MKTRFSLFRIEFFLLLTVFTAPSYPSQLDSQTTTLIFTNALGKRPKLSESTTAHPRQLRTGPSFSR